MISTDFPMASQ